MPHSVSELAKRSLLPPGLEPGNFADEITLPNTIVTFTSEAVHQATLYDREQRVGFSYVPGSNKWTATPSYEGTKYELHNGNVEVYDAGFPAIFHLLTRPEIMLHARPRPKKAIIDVMTEGLFGQILSEEQLEHKKRIAWEDALAIEPVATCTDIERTYERSWGTVGNMVSTAEGSFLWLRRDVSNNEATPHEELFNRFKDEVGIDNSHLRTRKNYERLSPQILKDAGHEKENRRRAYAELAARVLFPHYACYISNNPASKIMKKVHL